jgi:hypothetical protein
MISFISSSKFRGILAALILIATVENAFWRAEKPIDKFQPAIDSLRGQQPDMVIIGDSTLNRNVDYKALDHELSSLYHRKISTLKLSLGAIGGDVYYLMVRKYLLTSIKPEVPVLFTNWSSQNYQRTSSPQHLKGLVRYLGGLNDQTYLSTAKINANFWFRFKEQYCHTCYLGPQNSAKYLRNWALKILPISTFPKTFLDEADSGFGDLGFGQKNNYQAAPRNVSSSFIPEILRLSPETKFYFMLSHVANRGSQTAAEDNKFLNELTALLPNQGFDFNTITELDDPSQYLDNIHLQPFAKKIFTSLLAKKIFELKWIKQH